MCAQEGEAGLFRLYHDAFPRCLVRPCSPPLLCCVGIYACMDRLIIPTPIIHASSSTNHKQRTQHAQEEPAEGQGYGGAREKEEARFARLQRQAEAGACVHALVLGHVCGCYIGGASRSLVSCRLI